MRFKRKGVVLFIVLGTLLVVVILAAVILSLILSHARLTHHQTSRIQAYSAALAGVNLARENLRTGTWTTASCPPDDGCLLTDTDFPKGIIQDQQVRIIIRLPQTDPEKPCYNPPGNNACISATAIYTYTP